MCMVPLQQHSDQNPMMVISINLKYTLLPLFVRELLGHV